MENGRKHGKRIFREDQKNELGAQREHDRQTILYGSEPYFERADTRQRVYHRCTGTGVGYTNAEDTSTYTDELGFEKIPEANNRNLLKLTETQVNLLGEELKAILGEDYPLTDKYHMFIPSVCGGKRLGTILLAKYGEAFTDEAVALGEYGATVVGLEIQRNDQLAMIHERNLRMAVDMAICSLSYSEHDALQKILAQMEEDEDVIVASKIAAKYKLTNSVIVSALKKMESAGILETKSLGMKGTYIKVVNPYLKKTLTA